MVVRVSLQCSTTFQFFSPLVDFLFLKRKFVGEAKLLGEAIKDSSPFFSSHCAEKHFTAKEMNRRNKKRQGRSTREESPPLSLIDENRGMYTRLCRFAGNAHMKSQNA
ncbi:hypothetical protein Syun_009671 [Stephania yunnanensis]|uniref:Uncharacterized protein n=1 Tax=Stephania yunnanensis TaxID=152371 RepID=A0AAP0KF28_9MAGN